NTNIKGYNVSKCFQTLTKCANLSSLKIFLMSCNTADKFTTEIAKALTQLKNVSNLTLDLKLYNQSVSILGSQIAKCPKLTYLALDLRGENLQKKTLLEEKTSIKNMFDGLEQAIKHYQQMRSQPQQKTLEAHPPQQRRKPLQKTCLMDLSKPSNITQMRSQPQQKTLEAHVGASRQTVGLLDPQLSLLSNRGRGENLSVIKNNINQSRGRNLYFKLKNNIKGAGMAQATISAAYRSDLHRELITSCEFPFIPLINKIYIPCIFVLYVGSVSRFKERKKERILRLDQNKIYNDGAEYLFSQLAKSSQLQSLTLLLQFVLINDQLDSDFNSCLSKLVNLKYLDLDLSYQERKSTTELLQFLISKQQKEIPFSIYSVLIQDLLKQQAKYLIDYYNSKKEKNIEKYKPKEDIFEGIVSQLFNNNKYNQSFQFIGFGSEGFVLATKSLQRKQEIVLKVKEVENEEQIKAEIEIMKEINMSLVVQFYESYYIKDLNNQIYVVYEFEKCQCTLQNFLDRTLIDGEKEDQKLSICHQIMASINYLHHFDIIHNDIKPENYLVVINDQDIIVKLSDFGLAVKLSSDKQQFTTKNNYGSLLYQAPELQSAKDIRVYTKMTDIFSVGCVLTLLDNYKNFFQPQQYDQNKSTFIYPLAFVTMVQKNFNLPFEPSLFLDKKERINRKSEIYKYIQASVVFNMENRTDFNSFINQNLEQFYTNQADLQKIIKKSQKNLEPDLRIFKIIDMSYVCVSQCKGVK
ncbi:hypothetical protein ABPG72_017707, partial [Tetrahymena utriculariae]